VLKLVSSKVMSTASGTGEIAKVNRNSNTKRLVVKIMLRDASLMIS
jgi:hypothetical protein